MNKNQLTAKDVALVALLLKQENVEALTEEQLADLAAQAEAIAKAASAACRALNKRLHSGSGFATTKLGPPKLAEGGQRRTGD